MQSDASFIETNTDIAPGLSVVMPVYNEAATMAQIIRRVLEQELVQAADLEYDPVES